MDDTDESGRASSGPVPVCAIGASAGGVTALRSLFRLLPPNLGLAYVVVVHLAPDHPSALAEIIGDGTSMPVVQVEDGPPLKPNCVYVIPPDRELVIKGDDIQARPFSQPRGRRMPIDLFFESVAAGRGDGFAVVLTGAGSDGAAGVRAVKEGGGVIFVQEPSEAEYAMMPWSAIATGVADFVAPIPQLVDRIVDVARAKRAVGQLTADAADHDLRRVVGFLRARTGHDFSNYKRATVQRRVMRRVQVTRRSSVAEYADYVRDNPEEAQELFADLLISVTMFFRDPGSYEVLRTAAIDAIFDHADPERGIRVWSVGCATGEEAYSLAILLLEVAQARRVTLPIQVFATDLDEGALSTAREGRYSASIEADLSEERLRRYFVREGPHYRVKKEVRDIVLFATHSVLKDPPFMHLDLVACRNLLIYLERDLQRQVCSMFHYGLRPNGFLFLGSAESVDTAPELFSIVDREARLYRANPRRDRRLLALPRFQAEPPRKATEGRRAAGEGGERGVAGVHIAALEAHAPPSVLVDHDFRVVHLSPSAGRFLQPPGGAPTNELVAMAPPELRYELRGALYRAFRNGETSLTGPTVVLLDGALRRLGVQVSPAQANGTAIQHALVLFLDGGATAERRPDAEQTDNMRRLFEELRTAEERLVESRSQHELTVQELRAANEELQSINEEYRSTSEELETSKEELQSMNEELQTVNAELKTKLDSISSSHNDLENLIASTEIGTLFLDPELRIRMFTPPVASLFSITEADVGRPITDFTHKLLHDGVAGNAHRVLRDLASFEEEVQTRDGRWLLMRVRPYRTIDDRIDGVVMSFVEVTERRDAAERLRRSELRYRSLFETMTEGLILGTPVLGAEGRLCDLHVDDANPAAMRTLAGLAPGRRLRTAVPPLDDAFIELPERVLQSGTSESREVPGPKGRWFALHVWRLGEAEGQLAILLNDTTERRRSEMELKEARDLFALAARASRAGWGAWNLELGTVTWDVRAVEILGLARGSDRLDDWLRAVHADDRGRLEAALEEGARTGEPFDVEYRVILDGGAVRRVNGTGIFGAGDGTTSRRGTGLIRDITELRNWEEAQQLLIAELNHRVKNMLAVVQSIARQTLRVSGEAQSFVAPFEARLQALARAHGMLTRRNWVGARLLDLAREVVGAVIPDSGRVAIEGDRIDVSPNAAILLTMAFHELATNAIKYGSLSREGGRVDVTFCIEPGGEGEIVQLVWEERDGPSIDPPARQGFGTRMLQEGLAYELAAEVTVDFRPTGLLCVIDIPLNGKVSRA